MEVKRVFMLPEMHQDFSLTNARYPEICGVGFPVTPSPRTPRPFFLLPFRRLSIRLHITCEVAAGRKASPAATRGAV